MVVVKVKVKGERRKKVEQQQWMEAERARKRPPRGGPVSRTAYYPWIGWQPGYLTRPVQWSLDRDFVGVW